MYLLLSGIIALLLLLLTLWWWRYRSLACPASFTFLLENHFMNRVAGPDRLFERMGLGPGMRVLDVGCGPGRLTLPAARRVGEWGEVVALDLQEGMLAKLRRRMEAQGVANVRPLHAAAGSGAVAQGEFDRAMLVTVLGEIRDRRAALAEIYAALREGGVLSITEVIPDPHYMRRNRVRELCREAGFAESREFGNWLSYTLNFTKPVTGG